MPNKNIYQDDVVVLKVKNWQTADKMAEGFSRGSGRILFIAYGARHIKNRSGALVQNLTHANMQLLKGKKFDTLRQCDLLEPLMVSSDIEKLAYASFITELTSEMTPEREPQEEIYHLLVDSLKAVNTRNPRLVALSFALKLLYLCGTFPSFDVCVCCGKELNDSFKISAIQGGCICDSCKTGAEADFSKTASDLAKLLFMFDFSSEDKLIIKGRDVIMLEDFLHKFIFIQVEKPLKSLQFLAGL